MSTPVHDMMRVQIFGPVITVQPFADEAEAIAMANGVEFGLASSVWTADHGRALRCARAFDFGCVRRYGQSPPLLPLQCRARLVRHLLRACASSGRAGRLREAAGSLRAQPLPWVLVPATSKAADSTTVLTV